jgi:hypothetical protein
MMTRMMTVPALLYLAMALTVCAGQEKKDKPKDEDLTFKPGDMQIRMRYQVALRGQDVYLLLPGNRILEGVPKGGLEALNYDKICAAKPESCGTYTLRDGQMTITWGGKRAPANWKHVILKDGQEEMATAMWMKGYPFKARQRLEGNYRYSGSSGPGNKAISAGVLTLRLDGSYTEKRAATVTTTGGDARATAASEQSGTYEVSDYTLTLKTKDGVTTRHAFIIQGPQKDPARPSLVCYDGAVGFRSDK